MLLGQADQRGFTPPSKQQVASRVSGAAIISARVRSSSACSLAWRAILPSIYEHETIKGDLWGLLEGYMAEYPGAMQSGCGGGYIIVASDDPPAGSSRIAVRA